MNIHIHPCSRPNVGDLLNEWFWDEVLPASFLQSNPKDCLVGIGTVLNQKLPTAPRYHVLGAGAGYGTMTKEMISRCTFYCVRGPLTAKSLEIAPSLAVTDPAMLISKLRPIQKKANLKTSFMPHIGIDSSNYRRLIEDQLGWQYISPADDEASILHSIANSEKLITSAMHGAILADSYRTPWQPISTSNEILPFKWFDWQKTIGVTATIEPVPALWSYSSSSVVSEIKNITKRKLLHSKLKKLEASGRFYLSRDTQFNQLIERLESKFGSIQNNSWV